MSIKIPTRFTRRSTVGLGLLLVGSITAACSNSTAESTSSSDSPAAAHSDEMAMGVGPPPLWADGTQAVPTRHKGPQGQTGQFVAKCLYSHSDTVDPIVFPGSSTLSHRHDFYGATGIVGTSTAASLIDTQTTCNKPGDSAAYWQPTVLVDEKPITPLYAQAYYRAAPGIDPKSVKPFPLGLMLIAGDALASTPQTGEAAAWTCGVQTKLSHEVPDCGQGAPLHLVLTFPDCWDGANLDSPGHRDHATYSRDSACPKSHPISIPQLTVSVNFGLSGPLPTLRLASGNQFSTHGDFLNSWNESALEREVLACIHRDAVCDLASNREEDGPFFTN